MEWPSGEATACKAVYTGSIPVSTSAEIPYRFRCNARLAQRESASLTRKRSLVQSQYRARRPRFSGRALGQKPAVADVAQLVAHHLAKVRVASSSLVIRSSTLRYFEEPFHGGLVEWLGNGLQNRVHGFDSRIHLHANLPEFERRARSAYRSRLGPFTPASARCGGYNTVWCFQPTRPLASPRQ